MKSAKSVKIFSSIMAVFVLASVVGAAIEASRLNTRYSLREFFPKNHPILNNEELTSRRFQLGENPTYLVALSLNEKDAGTWLTPALVRELERVTQEISKVPGAKRVRSLANLEMAIETDSTLQVGPVLQSLPPSKWVDFVQSQALLRSQFVSKDLRSAMVMVEAEAHGSAEIIQLEENLRKAGGGAGRWDVDVAGIPAVQARLTDKVSQEVGKFLILSLLLFCGTFWFFYRNLTPTIFAAVGLIVTNVTSIAWLSLLDIPFTVLLSTLPIILSIAFVSLVIHTFHLWADRLARVSGPLTLADRFSMSRRVLRELALPNFLGSLTTAIGFVVLAAANIPAIRTYAIVISSLVMWTWFVTQILLIGFQHLLVPEPRAWNHARAFWMLKINRWSIPVISVTLAITFVFGASISKINFSGRLFDDLPKNEAVRQATERLDERFGGTVALDMSLYAAWPEAWKDPQLLAKLRHALTEMREIPGMGSVLSVTDFMNEKNSRSRAGVAETFFLFSMASENPLNHFVNGDFSEVRVASRLRDLPSAEIERIRFESRKILSAVDPRLTIRETGLAVNSHTLNQEVAKQLVYGFWHSLVVIGLLLVVIFRSVRWALIACLPNFVPPAVLIGALVIFQTPVKPGIALIFSIALGLAFNNTVYLLSRLKRIQSERKMKKLPLRRAMLEEGNPCFSESFLMFVGFLIFLTSDFKMNQTFGAYMILSIVAGALADLAFLPAVLREFSPFLWVKRATSKMFGWRKRAKAGAVVVAAISVFALLIFGALSARADDAKTILEKARAQLDSRNDQANVTLKIIEPNGEIKTRQLSLQTLRTGQGFKALVRIQAPADIKGTALLAEVENGSEQQWLYLPSNKQVRRVASSGKSNGVLGSELSPDDLNASALKGAKAKLISKNEKYAVIEVIPTAGATSYTRVLTTFAMPIGLPLKTEYYSGAQLKKTVEFQNYKPVDGKIYRAQLIRVKNLEKNRGTDIELRDLKVNTRMSAKDFTQGSLKESW